MTSFASRIGQTHRDPRNIAMHVVGWIVALGAVRRLLRGQVRSAVLRGALAAAFMGAGHGLEGNEPFGALRERLRTSR